MSDTIIEEMSRADAAFAGNRLLSTFAAEERGLVENGGELVSLSSGEIVLQRG